MRGGKPTAVGSATGIIAGLVCITPAAGYVDIQSAMIMCGISGVLCNAVAYQMKKTSHLDDALDVFACHGLGGIIGAVFTGVFASKAVNPSLAAEGLAVSGESKLFLANIVAVVAVAVYSVVLTYIVIKLVNLFMPISVSQETQSAGLDKSMHGEYAKYNERQPQHSGL